MREYFNEIVHGDCLDVMANIEDDSIDFVLADPPYGTTQHKWDSVIELEPMWREIKRIVKSRAAIVLFAQTPFDKILGASNIDMLRYEWIYEKTSATGFLNANKMPLKAHENILVFYDKLPTYNPQKTEGHKPVNTYTKHTDDGSNYGKTKRVSGGGNTDRFPRSVQIFSSDKQKSKLHPTQKPIELCKYLINTYSNEGDLVLDFVCGSGTTNLACQMLGRNHIGIESNKEYYNISLERLETG